MIAVMPFEACVDRVARVLLDTHPLCHKRPTRTRARSIGHPGFVPLPAAVAPIIATTVPTGSAAHHTRAGSDRATGPLSGGTARTTPGKAAQHFGSDRANAKIQMLAALTQSPGGIAEDRHAVVRHPRRCDLLRGRGGADRGRGPDEKGALNLERASGLPSPATLRPICNTRTKRSVTNFFVIFIGDRWL